MAHTMTVLTAAGGSHRSPYLWFWLAGAVLFAVSNVAIFVAAARHRRHPARQGAETGRGIPAGLPPALPVVRSGGSGKLRGPMGLANASFPFVTLRLEPDAVGISFGLFSFLAPPLLVDRRAGVVLFPARSRLGNHYLGVEVDGEPRGYFMASDVGSLLEAARTAGYGVVWEERRVL